MTVLIVAAGSRMGRAQRCSLSHDQHKNHRPRDTREKVQNTAHTNVHTIKCFN